MGIRGEGMRGGGYSGASVVLESPTGAAGAYLILID